MDMLAIALRAATFVVVSLIAGMPLFLWSTLGAVPGARLARRWRGASTLAALAGAGLALLGVLVSTAQMAGTALWPVDTDMVWLVLSATATGKAMVLRAVLLLAAAGLAWQVRLRAGVLVALPALLTLAWSGHAAGSEGLAGMIHLGADMVHLAAAALWLGGMACLLAGLACRARVETLAMLHAFAFLGTLIVALLVVTGLINALLILGPTLFSPQGLQQALGTTYGRLIGAKLLAFAAMLAMAASNRFRLTPAYAAMPGRPGRRLATSVALEISTGVLVLVLVAWAGTIDPTAPIS